MTDKGGKERGKKEGREEREKKRRGKKVLKIVYVPQGKENSLEERK